jgi:transposase-like protein
MMCTLTVSKLPDWVPEDALRYLEHTETGQSIRKLARRAGCHPSTILRQVRRIENQREDPLIDGMLTELAGWNDIPRGEGRFAGEPVTTLEDRSAEVMTRLAHPGAVLAIAEGMENAVVVRQGDAADVKFPVPRGLADAMALLGWISCTRSGRLSRYQITQNGRNALTRIVADRENKARSRRESSAVPSHGMQQEKHQPRPRRSRYGAGESPLDMLARLVDKNGDPFLPADLVQAGKRLREDFEVAQVGQHLAQATCHFDSRSCGASQALQRSSPCARDAERRAKQALSALGSGLSDIALRCCCYLEGLEAAERQLGWSARSGKVVLRIALQQLKTHYDTVDGAEPRERKIG